MAGQTLTQFSRRITRLGAAVAANADRLTRTVALAADQIVVSETPVDTGRAKSNWIVALGSAPAANIAAYAEGEAGSTAAANEAAALAQAERVIAGYNGDMGVEIYISNSLPYIEELNRGSSAQAPAQYVETALATALSIIRGGTIRLTNDNGNTTLFNNG